MTSTLHALDHATRLAEIAGEVGFKTAKGGPEDRRAATLCADAMQNAASVAGEVIGRSAASDRTPSIETRRKSPGSPQTGAAADAPAAVVRLEKNAKELSELRVGHRSATLSAVATGALTADEAIVRVDAVARFEALARHAWRSAAHLVSRGD